METWQDWEDEETGTHDLFEEGMLEDGEDEDVARTELLIEVKKEYFDVYQVDVEGVLFTFRGLGYGEYKDIVENTDDDMTREEIVCKRCVLDPVVADWSNMMHAMLPHILAHEIMKSSGLLPQSAQEMKDYRTEQELIMGNTIEEQLPCIIKAAFPELQFEEIRSWSLKKMCWYEARAKWILENIHGITFEGTPEIEKQLEQERFLAERGAK